MTPLAVLGALRLPSGERWIDVATEDQVADAHAILDPDPDAPRMVLLTRARGFSKSTDLGACALSLLVAGHLPHGAHAWASDLDQARILVDSMREVATASPEIAATVSFPSAYRVVCGDQMIEARASDAGGAFGLRSDLLMVDELAAWPSTQSALTTWEAIVSTVPKVPNARFVAITSAGTPSHWSHEVVKGARTSDAWHVSEIAGPAPWIDPASLEEQRRLLTPSQYARLWENVWSESEDTLALGDDLDACATLSGPLDRDPGRRYVVGVDLGLKRDATAIVVATLDGIPTRSQGGPTVVVAHKKLFRPKRFARIVKAVDLAEVEEHLRSINRIYRPALILCDPWQAASMSQRLRGIGLPMRDHVFSAASNDRRATMLYTLLRDRRLALDATDTDLLDELRRVRLVERNGKVRIDHDQGAHDDQVTALGLACYGLLGEGGVPPIARVYSYQIDARDGRSDSSPFTELMSTPEFVDAQLRQVENYANAVRTMAKAEGMSMTEHEAWAYASAHVDGRSDTDLSGR